MGSMRQVWSELTRALGAKVIRVLYSHFHKDLESDAKHTGRENVRSNNFRQVFPVHGRGIFRIRHGHEQPHANLVARFAGLEKNARPGDADRPAQVFKVLLVRIGRTNTHELRNLAAAGAATFGLCIWLLGGSSCRDVFGHLILLVAMAELSFRRNPAGQSGISVAGVNSQTYSGNVLSKGSTPPAENSSTEVPEKKDQVMWKNNNKCM